MRITLLILFLISGCASNTSGIGSNVSHCCADENYRTFTVVTDAMPGFLEPVMLNAFGTAFTAEGLQPVAENGDVSVVLRYEQDDLTEVQVRDDFSERTAPGGDVRYLARVVIEMTDGEKLVWAGSIQRTHTVSPGEYMHTGEASTALLTAFQNVLKGYPGE